MNDLGPVNTLVILLIVLGLFACMIAVIEAGRWLGRKHREKDPKAAKGLGPMEGAIYGLMGLLLAFTFSGAGRRFDARRDLIVRETNVIATAYLRINLLPSEYRPGLRESFRQYLENRLTVYRDLPRHRPAGLEADKRARDLQVRIWDQATDAIRHLGPAPNEDAVTTLVMQSLNDMFDITTAHGMALQTHPPMLIYAMMIVLLLASSLLAGYETGFSKARSWVHIFGFAGILSASIYMILDFEYPRVGLIRIDAADQFLIDLLAWMRR